MMRYPVHFLDVVIYIKKMSILKAPVDYTVIFGGNIIIIALYNNYII